METKGRNDWNSNPEKAFLSGDCMNEWPNQPVQIYVIRSAFKDIQAAWGILYTVGF